MRFLNVTSAAAFLILVFGAWQSPAIGKDIPRLADNVGKTITIQATTTREISAHMMSPPGPGWKDNYMVYDGMQIVVYSKTPIKCSGIVRLTGKVREVKSGGDPRAKSYHGYHFDAEKWECLK